MKCQPKANNNREAVVVCARHVVKRPSKRMRASIYVMGDVVESGDVGDYHLCLQLFIIMVSIIIIYIIS